MSHVLPCCRPSTFKNLKKPQLLLIDRGGDLASNTLLLDLRHRNCEDKVHQQHLQRSIASGTRCKRRRRFRTTAAIKLPVCNGKTNNTHSMERAGQKQCNEGVPTGQHCEGSHAKKKTHFDTIGKDCPSSSCRSLMVSWLVACSSALLFWLSSHSTSWSIQYFVVSTRSPVDLWSGVGPWKRNTTTCGVS